MGLSAWLLVGLITGWLAAFGRQVVRRSERHRPCSAWAITV